MFNNSCQCSCDILPQASILWGRHLGAVEPALTPPLGSLPSPSPFPPSSSLYSARQPHDTSRCSRRLWHRARLGPHPCRSHRARYDCRWPRRGYARRPTYAGTVVALVASRPAMGASAPSLLRLSSRSRALRESAASRRVATWRARSYLDPQPTCASLASAGGSDAC
jgi:hypothetical protein